MAVSLEAGVFPVTFSPFDETDPDISGDVVSLREVLQLSDKQYVERDSWCELGSEQTTVLDYTPMYHCPPKLAGGRLYSLVDTGLRITDLASGESTTVPSTVYPSGLLTMSTDGLATWAPSARSVAIFDSVEQTLTVLPYSSVPLLATEQSVPAFARPMASGSRVVMGGNYLTAQWITPLTVWDRMAGTRVDMGTGVFMLRVHVVTPQYAAWVDNRDRKIHVYDLASGDTTVLAQSVAAFEFDAIDMSGNAVVWVDQRHGNNDIYWCDVVTGEERRLTSDRADQQSPAIDGDRVVWADERWGDYDIYGCVVVPGEPNDVVPPSTTHTVVDNPDGSATVSLSATDSAGVAATYYSLDFDEWVEGESFTIDEPGWHYVEYYSEDTYGNIEGSHEYEFLLTVPTETRIVASRDVIHEGETVELTVGLKTTGIAAGPGNSCDVRVEKRTASDGAWMPVASLTTDASGVATCQVTPDVHTEYRAAFDGELDYTDASKSVPITIRVKRLATLSFLAPMTSAYMSAEVHGQLKGTGGRALSGKPVEIWRYSDGGWRMLSVVKTDSNGNYRLKVAPKSLTSYKAVFQGDADHMSSGFSAVSRIHPRVKLARTTSWGTLYRDKAYYAKGFIEPYHSTGNSNKVKIRAYKRGSDGKFRYSKSFTARYIYYSRSKTKYSAKIALPSRGTWKLVAYHSTDSGNYKTYGSADYVIVK